MAALGQQQGSKKEGTKNKRASSTNNTGKTSPDSSDKRDALLSQTFLRLCGLSGDVVELPLPQIQHCTTVGELRFFVAQHVWPRRPPPSLVILQALRPLPGISDKRHDKDAPPASNDDDGGDDEAGYFEEVELDDDQPFDATAFIVPSAHLPRVNKNRGISGQTCADERTATQESDEPHLRVLIRQPAPEILAVFQNEDNNISCCTTASFDKDYTEQDPRGVIDDGQEDFDYFDYEGVPRDHDSERAMAPSPGSSWRWVVSQLIRMASGALPDDSDAGWTHSFQRCREFVYWHEQHLCSEHPEVLLFLAENANASTGGTAGGQRRGNGGAATHLDIPWSIMLLAVVERIADKMGFNEQGVSSSGNSCKLSVKVDTAAAKTDDNDGAEHVSVMNESKIEGTIWHNISEQKAVCLTNNSFNGRAGAALSAFFRTDGLQAAGGEVALVSVFHAVLRGLLCFKKEPTSLEPAKVRPMTNDGVAAPVRDNNASGSSSSASIVRLCHAILCSMLSVAPGRVLNVSGAYIRGTHLFVDSEMDENQNLMSNSDLHAASNMTPTSGNSAGTPSSAGADRSRTILGLRLRTPGCAVTKEWSNVIPTLFLDPDCAAAVLRNPELDTQTTLLQIAAGGAERSRTCLLSAAVTAQLPTCLEIVRRLQLRGGKMTSSHTNVDCTSSGHEKDEPTLKQGQPIGSAQMNHAIPKQLVRKYLRVRYTTLPEPANFCFRKFPMQPLSQLFGKNAAEICEYNMSRCGHQADEWLQLFQCLIKLEREA
ncbi:unnamed protein product [Amoebophrya sp. A25]|nr:unnamed protein product [Amoebophrya sp. A25]|eukprot:GSA25T00000037001.1